jgi:quinolinate synthase
MNLPMAPTHPGVAGLSPEEIARMQGEVRSLAAERHAVILAHNYQVPEVQDVADYVGDSLGLSRKAAETDCETIVFCGVHFMAETASVLCPEKTVLIPDLDAGCSLAASIDAEQLATWRAQYPEGVVVMYVNTTAEVKALTDYCCTSANAVDVVRHIGWALTWRRSSDDGCTCGTASATCTRASVPRTSKPRARRTRVRTS